MAERYQVALYQNPHGLENGEVPTICQKWHMTAQEAEDYAKAQLMLSNKYKSAAVEKIIPTIKVVTITGMVGAA